MAVIYRGPLKGFKLDDQDMLTLGRALIGEGGDPWKLKAPSRRHASALFWTWVDRYLLMRAKWSQEGWEFNKLIQEHSIPVKPSTLDPAGSWCKKHPNDCTPTNIRRRKRVQSLTIEQLKTAGVWTLVEDARDGKLERVIQEPTYDFASCSRVSGINIDNNCFQTYQYLSADRKKQVIFDGDKQAEVQIDAPVEEVAESGVKALLALPVGYLLYRIGDWAYGKFIKGK